MILPALIGGDWAADLDVSAPESPYLAFIVGLHVATKVSSLRFDGEFAVQAELQN